MSRFVSWSFYAVMLSVSVWTLGCGSGNQPIPIEKSNAEAHDHDHMDGHDHEHQDIEKSLAQLSAEDRKLAEAQKTCPVTDEPLGAMGVPVKLTVKDQEVFICCEGCKEKLESDPDTYLAKLKPAK